MAVEEEVVPSQNTPIGQPNVSNKRIRPSVFHRFVLTPLVVIFDVIFHLLILIFVTLLGATLLGNYLGSAVTQFVTTGDPSAFAISNIKIAPQFQDHLDWILAGAVVFMLLSLTSYIAHRARHNGVPALDPALAAYYGAGQVSKLSPSTAGISFYKPIYVARRDAITGLNPDEEARQALSAARERNGVTSGSLGICVVGRAASGTTRLAYEAIKKELADWTFINWQLDSQNAFELLAGLRKQNAKLVIWLDNLPKYLSTSGTPLINSLPITLGKYGFRYVLVATCSNLEPDSPVRDRFSDLMNRLVMITPADITRADAQRLVTELAKTGEPIEIEEPVEGTPGSILLAVNKTRDISYARLSQTSKQILRAVKLLRSAGVREYIFARLISTLDGVLAFDKTM